MMKTTDPKDPDLLREDMDQEEEEIEMEKNDLGERRFKEGLEDNNDTEEEDEN